MKHEDYIVMSYPDGFKKTYWEVWNAADDVKDSWLAEHGIPVAVYVPPQV